MKTSDILRRAGDISRERGWCQDWYERDGKFCLLGSIAEAAGCEPSRSIPDYAAPMEHIDQLFGTMGGHLWNDAPGRTHAEVLIALDAAYVLALQEEGADLDEVFK